MNDFTHGGDATIQLSITGIAALALLTKKMFIDADGKVGKIAAASPGGGRFIALDYTGTPDQILDRDLRSTLEHQAPSQAIIAAPLPTPVGPDGLDWQLRLKKAPKLLNWMPFSVASAPPLRIAVASSGEMRSTLIGSYSSIPSSCSSGSVARSKYGKPR